MRAARILTITMTIALPAMIGGCRTAPDPSIELLESELRWYEDQLYLMNRELSSCQQQLESARRYNHSLKSEMVSADPGGTRANSSPGKPSGRKGFFPFNILPNKSPDSRNDAGKAKDDSVSEDFEIPNITQGSTGNDSATPSEIPADAVPEASLGPEDPNTTPDDSNPSFDDDEVFDEEGEPFTIDDISHFRSSRSIDHDHMIHDGSVSKVVFNPQLTGGHNSDGLAGDDGLYVVLEPKSANGEYVAEAGELTIEVFDANQPRSLHSRIARWDFDAGETAASMRKSLLGKGVHLQLPWPAAPPQVTDLVIAARFICSDGKRLKTERQIKIDPTGQRSLRR